MAGKLKAAVAKVTAKAPPKAPPKSDKLVIQLRRSGS
jgi:hypothetical protein